MLGKTEALTKTAVESRSTGASAMIPHARLQTCFSESLKPKPLSSASGRPSALQLQAASEAAARFPQKSASILLSRGEVCPVQSLPRGLLDLPARAACRESHHEARKQPDRRMR